MTGFRAEIVVRPDWLAIWCHTVLGACLGAISIVVALVAAAIGNLAIFDAFIAAFALTLVFVTSGLSVSLIIRARVGRISYTFDGEELCVWRGAQAIVRIPRSDICDLNFTQPFTWFDVLFGYPWPDYPFASAVVRSTEAEGTLEDLPQIALWGERRVDEVAAKLRTGLALPNRISG